MYIFFVASIILTIFLIPKTLKRTKQYWDIKDTPTVSPGGAVMGQCEIVGTAQMKVEDNESQPPLLISPFSKTECVWYSITLSHLIKIEDNYTWSGFYNEQIDAFSLCDKYAKINIYSKNAEIESSKIFYDQIIPVDNILEYFQAKLGNPEINNIFEIAKKEKIAVTENVIKNGQNLFVHGSIDCELNNAQLVVGNKGEEKIFVSTIGEKSVIRNRLLISLGVHILTVVSMIISLSLGFETFGKSVSPIRQSIAFYILIALYFVVFNYFRSYNRYIRFLQRIRFIDSTIAVVLKRRNDLIPKLIDTIELLNQHEIDTQELISQLRANSGHDSIKLFLATFEKYPEIKSSENFLNLQHELGRTEEKIAMARSFRNDAVLFYNNYRNTFSGFMLKPFFSQINQ